MLSRSPICLVGVTSGAGRSSPSPAKSLWTPGAPVMGRWVEVGRKNKAEDAAGLPHSSGRGGTLFTWVRWVCKRAGR